MTDQYAVFGNPIAHSKSPRIHALFAEQTKQDLKYNTVLVEQGQFANVAQQFFDAGGDGLNITVPFKLDAFKFADELRARAQLAGAINTLKKNPDGKIFGDNTDGIGLVCDITQNLEWGIEGKNILILGAGGAVRGILAPLMAEQPESVVLVNRTPEKAKTLVNLFDHMGNISTHDVNSRITTDAFDLLINGTSASLTNELPALNPRWLSASSHCYDMMYGKEDTAFMKWAKEHGGQHVYDGLGMLVEQAAESFYIWRGVRPETKSVIEKVRSEL